MHSGTSAERGHYYCYARSSKVASAHAESALNSKAESHNYVPIANPADTSKEGEWMMFNDSLVRPSSFESFTSITKTFPTDVAYPLKQFFFHSNLPQRDNYDFVEIHLILCAN